MPSNRTAGMNAGVEARSVRGERTQSLFYRDLGLSPATHTSSLRVDAASPKQDTAALWRESGVGGWNPPPPPFYTLEDRMERSPESNVNLSFHSSPSLREKNSSYSRTLLLSPSGGGGFSLPSGENQDLQGSLTSPQQAQISGTSSWWSPVRERRSGSVEAVERDGNGPVSGVVQQQQSVGLLTLSVPGEIVRPEFLAGSAAIDGAEECEGWVTVFGFGVDETNSVMREFEKCGRIINHVSGPGGANWVHLQYQNHYDAQKALHKNGIRLNGALIIGVKRLDPSQYKGLPEKVNLESLAVTPLPPRSSTRIAAKPSAWSQYTQPAETGGPALRPLSVIASPAKSKLSMLVDLVFGM